MINILLQFPIIADLFFQKLPEGDHVGFILDLAKKFHGRVGKEDVLFELGQQICKCM